MGKAVAELSIIIPFVNEYPQLIFTLRAVAEELKGRVDFEIIAIDNFVPSVERDGHGNDKGFKELEACLPGNPWLKLYSYGMRLSHWQAKRLGVEVASGKFLLFLDAHVMPGRNSIYNMFSYYRDYHSIINGSIHLPLTYKILEWRKLIYRLDADLSLGKVGYTFTPYRDSDEPYYVPCMSTCGMLITREIYESIGGFPKRLGSYGGGEQFFNFSLAVTGRNVCIFPGEPLYHHGDKRGYSIRSLDVATNMAIATYLFGGTDLLKLYLANVKQFSSEIKKEQALTKIKIQCGEQRQLIRSRQKFSIHAWIEKWKGEDYARA